MKVNILRFILSFVLSFSVLNSAGQTFQWAKSILSTSSCYVREVTLDNSGNIIICGEFQGTTDFDPNAGVANLTSNGGYDFFVCKLNSAGNFLWARSFGSTGGDAAESIKADAAGNIYVTGVFSLIFDADPSPSVFNVGSLGGYDIFLLKLSSAGNLTWVRRFGSASNHEWGHKLVLDASANIYLTGVFYNTVDFDPGAGTANLTASGTSQDAFILKLNSAGAYIWAKKIGGTGQDVGNALTLDPSGNVLVTGQFQATVDFDPGSGTSNLISAGNSDVFILKLNNAGNFIWAKRLGGPDGDIGTGIDTDAAGYVYTTGYFSTSADFDPGAGTSTLTSAGSIDIFISKLNSSGNFIWARKIGGTSNDQPHDIEVDNYGYVYTCGEFYSTVDFNPNAGVANLTSSGANDTYFNKIHQSGTHAWAYRIGAALGDYGSSILIDNSYNLFLAGIFTQQTDFNPFAGTFNINNGGGVDGFLLKIGQSIPLPVDFVNFDVKEKENIAELEWHTASETNNDYFTVERSLDNNEWIELTKIQGAGNSSSVLHYRYNDEQPLNGISYYRIKQTDFNGDYSYSEVLAARFKNLKYTQLNLFPNPAINELVIDFDGVSVDEITITDLSGRDVKYAAPVVFTGTGRVILDITGMPDNIYFISAGSAVKKFVKAGN